MRYSNEKLNVFARALAVGCSLAFVAWAVLWPVAGPIADAALADTANRPETGADLPSAVKDVALDVVWNRKLQEHIAGAPQVSLAEPPQKPLKQTPPSQLIDIVLIGTMLENGNSFAMVADGSGRMDTQPVGAVLQLAPAGMLVESVNSGSAIIRYQDVRYELHLQDGKQARAASLGPAASGPAADSSQGIPSFESLDEELDWLNSSADDDTMGQDEGTNIVPTGNGAASPSAVKAEDLSEGESLTQRDLS